MIDLNGMVVGRRARDFLCPHDDDGPAFTRQVLVEAGLPNSEATWDELGFLFTWPTLTRLPWALEHGYAERADRLTANLRTHLPV